MKDTEAMRYLDDLPEWAEDIIDKHDLALRSDTPVSAASVLLLDAGTRLKELGVKAFRKQAICIETKLQIEACKAMIADAEKLYPLCPSCSDGRYSKREDGLLEWCPNPSPA